MKKYTFEISVADFMNRYVSKGIRKDRKFQRKTCWSIHNETGYLSTMLSGGDLDTFSIIDNKSAMEASKQDIDRESEMYFDMCIKRGEMYTSIDGQNREAALVRFLNNQFTITGNFYDKDRKLISIRNKFFKDLPPRLKDALMDACLAVNLINQISVEEMHDQFRKRNSGKPLNAQQYRNSYRTDLSDIIRDIAEDSLISKIWEASQEMKDHRISESADEEMTAKMYMTLVDTAASSSSVKGFSNYDLKKKDLDDFYKMGIGKSRGASRLMEAEYPEEYAPYQIKKVRQVMSQVARIIEAKGCKKNSIKMRSLWALFIACGHLYNDGKRLRGGSMVDFYDLVDKVNSDLLAEGDLKLSQETVKWNKAGQVGQKPSPSKYYRHMAGNTDIAVSRIARIDIFLERLTSDKKFSSLLD